eukprot:6222824-Karenia_brevis.AAC.1
MTKGIFEAVMPLQASILPKEKKVDSCSHPAETALNKVSVAEDQARVLGGHDYAGSCSADLKCAIFSGHG